MKEDEDLSANIKEYLENSPFEVHTYISWTAGQMLTTTRLKTRPATRKLS